eukprot:413654_1
MVTIELGQTETTNDTYCGHEKLKFKIIMDYWTEKAKSTSILKQTEFDIVRDGYLRKDSKILSIPRKRWMVLTPNYLYSYKSEKSMTNSTEIIDLTEYNKIKHNNDKQFVLISTAKQRKRVF